MADICLARQTSRAQEALISSKPAATCAGLSDIAALISFSVHIRMTTDDDRSATWQRVPAHPGVGDSVSVLSDLLGQCTLALGQQCALAPVLLSVRRQRCRLRCCPPTIRSKTFTNLEYFYDLLNVVYFNTKFAQETFHAIPPAGQLRPAVAPLQWRRRHPGLRASRRGGGAVCRSEHGRLRPAWSQARTHAAGGRGRKTFDSSRAPSRRSASSRSATASARAMVCSLAPLPRLPLVAFCPQSVSSLLHPACHCHNSTSSHCPWLPYEISHEQWLLQCAAVLDRISVYSHAFCNLQHAMLLLKQASQDLARLQPRLRVDSKEVNYYPTKRLK